MQDLTSGSIARHLRRTSSLGFGIAAACMAVVAVTTHVAGAAMVRVFSSDAGTIAVGEEYLRIVSWNFMAAGLVFVSSSMFQALGNTVPPLLTSFSRIAIVSAPLFFMARLPGFELWWIWYLSVAGVTLQMTQNLFLLLRELGLRVPALTPATTL